MGSVECSVQMFLFLRKDERGPSSVRRTLEPSQRQRWGERLRDGVEYIRLFRAHRHHQNSGAVRKSRWPSWAPVPNKPTVSVDVKQHSTNQNIDTILN